ncbi:hypothetical protein GQ42DRAFT_180421 [Ramicandelaber brevisporus]|nr:hypothetical protein GQ42DRAFT_180421 [Ramicandelaber brevisporus]
MRTSFGILSAAIVASLSGIASAYAVVDPAYIAPQPAASIAGTAYTLQCVPVPKSDPVVSVLTVTQTTTTTATATATATAVATATATQWYASTVTLTQNAAPSTITQTVVVTAPAATTVGAPPAYPVPEPVYQAPPPASVPPPASAPAYGGAPIASTMTILPVTKL